MSAFDVWKDKFARQGQFLLDLGWLVLALVVAYLLRFDFRIPSEMRTLLWAQLPWVVLIQFLRGVWTQVPGEEIQGLRRQQRAFEGELAEDSFARRGK